MTTTEKILEAIFRAIDEHNQRTAKDAQLGKTDDTVLFGQETTLDSIGLLSLIVAIEENLEEQFGIEISLADEKAVAQKISPLKTIATLSNYISQLIKQNPDG